MLPSPLRTPGYLLKRASLACCVTGKEPQLYQTLGRPRGFTQPHTVCQASRLDSEDQAVVKRALELADRAASSWDIMHTDFYTPPIVSEIVASVKPLASIEACAWGGFPQAERCRVLIGKEDLMLAAQENLTEEGGVAAIKVQGTGFAFDAANHRDFLGACLGTGIERSKVGDILVQGEQGALIMVAPQLVEHLEGSLVQVRSVSVQTRQISLSELSVPEPQVERIRSMEASLRLDAIASAGFRMPRSKMAEMVKSGDVRVNWKPAKAASSVSTGDVISCAGKGRVEVGEVSKTKKDRFAVELVRML